MRWGVRLFVQVHALFLFKGLVFVQTHSHEEYIVDVAKLAALTQGTELVVLENAIHSSKSYKLEDFFWTGSGDGPDEDDKNTHYISTDHSTVYSTKTVFSTVYVTPNTLINQTITKNNETCTHCIPPTPEGEIVPTPTLVDQDGDEIFTEADRQFWLLTILKSDGKDPDINGLKKSLGNLYKKAFLRQQAQHLGITSRTKRETKNEKTIDVFIHKIDKITNNGDQKIQLVYHVAVSGQPVDATTAAEDMRLVTDEEVKTELGYPFLVKAEPYIKLPKSEEIASEKPTWIVVIVSLIIICLIFFSLIFLTIYVSKQNGKGLQNKQQVFNDQSLDVVDNSQTEKKLYKSGRRNQEPSPTYINFHSQSYNQTSDILPRPQSGSSSSSLSNSSIDISPLMGLGKHHHRKHRSKATSNKTAPIPPSNKSSISVIETDVSSISSGSPKIILKNNRDPGVVSPKSYLSMPSIKSFPRSNNPEPLNKVLEPVIVSHLDMPDDEQMFLRHGSIGTSGDPGIIGPVVWNMHKQRLQRGVSLEDDMNEENKNVSKMRKRFHDLLDDTFSLFGSRRESISSDHPLETIEVKSKSALERPSSDTAEVKVRPKTSGTKRQTNLRYDQPKGAWMSTAPSPLGRPLSAPFMRPSTAPRVDIDQILSDGRLQPNDPAVPLIAAIKSEIEKCSLPGSTTNINE